MEKDFIAYINNIKRNKINQINNINNLHLIIIIKKYNSPLRILVNSLSEEVLNIIQEHEES